MIQWFDAALDKRLGLFSAALHAVCFKYSCIVMTGMAFCNSCVVESLLSVCEVPGSILRRGIHFIGRLTSAAIAASIISSTYFLLQM